MTTTTIDPQALGNRLDEVASSQEALTKQVGDLTTKWRDLAAKSDAHGSTEFKRVTEQLDKLAPTVERLESERQNLEKRLDTAEQLAKASGDEAERLKGLLAKLEARAQDGGFMPGDGSVRKTLGELFVEHERFKSWHERVTVKADTSRKTTGAIALPKASMWLRKDSNLSGYGSDAVGDIATPMYRPGILEIPKRIPILRTLIPSLPTGGQAGSVISYRETDENPVVTELASAISGNPTTLTVKNASGLSSASRFNQITVSDGSNSETKTVTNVNGNVVTVSVAFANDYDVEDTKVTCKTYIHTAAGTLKHQRQSTFGKYTVPMATLAEIAVFQNQKLRHIPGLRDLVQRRGVNSLGRNEELNGIYGPGDGTTGIRGLATDTAIATLAAWSASAAGTNAIDHLIDAYYTLWAADVMATAALVSVAYHKRIAKLKGTDGHYIYFQNGQPGAPDRVMALRLAGSSVLSDADGFIGDFELAATIYDSEDVMVEMGYSDDDFDRNQVRMRIEEEIGLGIELPSQLRQLNLDAPPST